MSEPTDGWGENVAGMLRLAAQLASQYAEHIARRREQTSRAEAEGQRTAALLLRERLTAERDAARALTAPTSVPGWWDAASKPDVAHAWEVARAWAATDPRLAETAAKMEAEIRARYGVDAHGLWAEVRAQHASGPAERAEAAAVLAADRAAGARDAQAAPTLTAVLDRPAPVTSADVDLLAPWGMRYDSPEARAARAARTRAAAGPDVEAADALITADLSQATPPAAAVAPTAAAGQQAKAKTPRRGRGAEQQAER